MDPEHWRRVEELYHAALTRSPQDWSAFLDRACTSDPELRREVDSLLTEPASAGQFLGAGRRSRPRLR
jgi:hypothetical protein